MKVEICALNGDVIFSYEEKNLSVKKALEYCAANNISLRGMRLYGISLVDANLKGLDMCNSMLINCNFNFANLYGVNFSGCDLTGSSFRNADLRQVNFKDVKMFCCDVTGSKKDGPFFDADQSFFKEKKDAPDSPVHSSKCNNI
jgi:uncharacterized protein YjbI with pentapeptide repeats